MSRIFNFSAGPSTLPLAALEAARDEMVEYKNSGMSLVEASHRGKEYDEVHRNAMALFRELLGLPENYKVLFLQGGATLQFAMVAMNCLPQGASCDFTLSGSWAKKAYGDHKKLGNVRVIFDGKENNYTSLPDLSSLKVAEDAAYLHLTSNETIGGVQWQSWPDTGPVPIVCDMSSDMLSRAVPVDKFGLIYAGAQKNLGPAGVTVVIIRQDMLDRCPDSLPTYLNYKTHADSDSLYNTPPVFAIYMMGKVLQWVKDQGGLKAIEELANKRAGILYDTLEKHSAFYKCPVDKNCRSRMNVVFRLPSEDLEKKFISEASAQGFSGLKGHRSVGGCRASVYNAMPMEGATELAKFMEDFAGKNG